MRATRNIGNSARLAAAATLALSAAAAAPAAGPIVYVDQGKAWKPALRDEFYSRDQGSRVIPWPWVNALRTDDGKPFLWDGLARYGYLANPASADGLPVGFMKAADKSGRQDFAMNCSACHTRQISVGGTDYRIDGGPALVDFQGFFTGLVAAVGRALASDEAFAQFAARIPGAGPGLKSEVTEWYAREKAMVDGSLKGGIDWGYGRLDAVSMIFNRLTGTDIGTGYSPLMPENIMPAVAPVRYPFLWNAPIQDRTQWPGFARNGNELYGLVRNLGQVYGVFGTFRPRRAFDKVDFITYNSANWKGLGRIERLVEQIGPPRWPWGYDPALAGQGGDLFEAECASCHGVRAGPVRLSLEFPFFKKTWATPLCDVGTDSRQYDILGRPARTGVYEGVKIPFGSTLGPNASAFELLGISVVGSIVQHELDVSVFHYASSASAGTLPKAATPRKQAMVKELLDTYAPPTPQACGKAGGAHKYESRVLQGIWATAPYLHNGSVPTLTDLLNPGEDRPKSFNLGRQYSPELIGLARQQPGSPYERETTCDKQQGNSRCGHEYGTGLSPAQKAALLEYLKSI